MTKLMEIGMSMGFLLQVGRGFGFRIWALGFRV